MGSAPDWKSHAAPFGFAYCALRRESQSDYTVGYGKTANGFREVGTICVEKLYLRSSVDSVGDGFDTQAGFRHLNL
jgi:hypothetical protein